MTVFQCFFAIFFMLYPPSREIGMQAQNKDLKMHFKPVFGTENLILDDKKYITEQSDTLSISTFRFYISQIQYVFEDGSTYSEPNSVHLLDAEKEESLSLNIKNVPDKTMRFVAFNIGVDSIFSVSGALTGDLDPILGMYWTWNTGYINAKIEGKSKSCHTPKNIFEFHIGGYLSPYNTLRQVRLPVKNTSDNTTIVIEADARKWFSNIKLSETNSVLMPNKTAMRVADNYAQMFKVNNEK